MNFDITYVEKLAKILSEGGLTEIVLQDGEKLIELRKEKEILSAQPVAVAMPVAAPVEAKAAPENAEPVKEAVKGTPVTSPMVGTFYKASSPTSAPFVKVGDTVAAGQVICIIEAMKLMNEIEAEVSGKITQICVEDGQPIEYGQVLMYVE